MALKMPAPTLKMNDAGYKLVTRKRRPAGAQS